MNNIEIKNFNKKCAKILGIKTVETASGETLYSIESLPKILIPVGSRGASAHVETRLLLAKLEQLQFHSNWDWIMEVVERIKYIDDNQSEFFNDYYRIDFQIDFIHGVTVRIDKERIFLQTAFGEGQLKDAVVNAVDEFINWLNNEKK